MRMLHRLCAILHILPTRLTLGTHSRLNWFLVVSTRTIWWWSWYSRQDVNHDYEVQGQGRLLCHDQYKFFFFVPLCGHGGLGLYASFSWECLFINRNKYSLLLHSLCCCLYYLWAPSHILLWPLTLKTNQQQQTQLLVSRWRNTSIQGHTLLLINLSCLNLQPHK